MELAEGKNILPVKKNGKIFFLREKVFRPHLMRSRLSEIVFEEIALLPQRIRLL